MSKIFYDDLVDLSKVEKKINKVARSEEEKHERGIKNLPGSLIEAITLAEKSELVRRTLGDHVFTHFIKNKKMEWDNFRTHVTQYEIETYLPIL